MKKIFGFIILIGVIASLATIPNNDHRGTIRMVYNSDTLTMSFTSGDSVKFVSNHNLFSFKGKVVANGVNMAGTASNSLLLLGKDTTASGIATQTMISYKTGTDTSNTIPARVGQFFIGSVHGYVAQAATRSGWKRIY